MKRKFRIMAAAFAAVTAMSCTTLTSFADKLRSDGGILYRYSDSGEVKGKYTGWAKTKTGRYYYKDGVKLKSRWLSSKGKRTYFLRKDGRMATGDVKIGGKEYLFGADGKLLPDNFGISVKITRFTKEKVTVSYSHDNTGIAKCELDMYDNAYIERLTDNGWERVGEKSDGNDSLTPIYGRKNVNVYFWTNGGDPLPNGKYRLALHGMAWSEQLVGGKKSFSFRPEFEVTDKTEHEFSGPPSLMIARAGKVGAWQAGTGSYSWENDYSDSEFGTGAEADCEDVLHWNWGRPYEAEADDVITVTANGLKDPDRIEVKCWDAGCIGSYDAYGNYETVPADGLTFKPKKGAYIYEIHAFWDAAPKNDILTVSGSVYYGIYIDAK